MLGLSALARARPTIRHGRVTITAGLSALARARPTIRHSRLAIALGLSALARARLTIRRGRVAIKFRSRALAGPLPAILRGSHPVGGSFSPSQRGTVQGLVRSPDTCTRLGRLGNLVALLGGLVSLLGSFVSLPGGVVAVPAGVVTLVGCLVSLVGGVIASVAGLVAQVGCLVACVAGDVASITGQIAFVGDVVSLLTGMIALLGRVVALLTSIIALLRGPVSRLCFRPAPSRFGLRPTPTDHAQTILDRMSLRTTRGPGWGLVGLLMGFAKTDGATLFPWRGSRSTRLIIACGRGRARARVRGRAPARVQGTLLACRHPRMGRPPRASDAPAVVFLGMAATVTTPMVAWMRYRGHHWQPTLEMAASMIIPTLAAIALLAAGVLGFGALMGLEHVAMLLGMLVAMLLRIDEYTSHAHHTRDAIAA